jgi:hypothetical protein
MRQTQSLHPATTETRTKRCRPPPIILLKFRGEMKNFTKGKFEFRNTRNGMEVVTREMADYSDIMRHLDAHRGPYYRFHFKSMIPVKAVIQQLAGDTPTKDMSNELVALD